MPRSIGWIGLLAFLGWVFGSENAVSFGGDTGALLWVALHFFVNPFLGVLVATLMLLSGRSPGRPWVRLSVAAASIIPLLVAFLSLSGDPRWGQVLGLGFHTGSP